jgi:hypothetical protein
VISRNSVNDSACPSVSLAGRLVDGFANMSFITWLYIKPSHRFYKMIAGHEANSTRRSHHHGGFLSDGKSDFATVMDGHGDATNQPRRH